VRTRHHGEMSRRGFLRAAGGIAAAAALGQACRFAGLVAPTGAESPTPFPPAVPASTEAASMAAPTAVPPSPVPTPESLVGRVAMVRTTDRAEGARRALELLGINPVEGKSVFLKPNFNSADPAPGSTDGELLRALVEEMLQMGADRLTIGDRSGMGDTRWVMQTKGAFELADEFGMDAVVLDDLSADDWLEPAAPEGSHWRRGFRVARPVLEAEAVVQTCNLKTHRFGGHFTLSLKNSVGLVAKSVPGEGYNYMTELHNSPDQRRMIAEINAAYTPALVVLDGVEAFLNGGPDVGEKVEAGVILAGADRVAIDAVAVAILRDLGTTVNVRRGPVFQQEQIARAVELGLGAPGPEAVTILTENTDGQSYADRLMGILTGPGE
jgi:uncharacterized protein (DUF362 family)